MGWTYVTIDRFRYITGRFLNPYVRQVGMQKINENDVYATDTKHRRVVGVLGKYIYYSTGGDTNRACQRQTFLRWLRERKPKKVHDSQDDLQG